MCGDYREGTIDVLRFWEKTFSNWYNTAFQYHPQLQSARRWTFVLSAQSYSRIHLVSLPLTWSARLLFIPKMSAHRIGMGVGQYQWPPRRMAPTMEFAVHSCCVSLRAWLTLRSLLPFLRPLQWRSGPWLEYCWADGRQRHGEPWAGS